MFKVGPRQREFTDSGSRPVAGPVRISPTDTIAELLEKAARVVPSERQLRWQALEFQAFVHFGMNTFTDREWGEGTEDPKLFNPTDLDANQWVEAVQAAGIRGLIVTAKHHDGFCLWPSRFTEHSVKNSPWKEGKGDVVGEVAAACRKAGLAFGVYLSPWDRHEPSYGDSPRYNEHFKNQLRELLTNYGEISEVWFDGACGEGPNGKRQVYDWAGYFTLIRELQPGAVISIMGPDARWIGNEAGVTRESEWSVIPVVGFDDLPDETEPRRHRPSRRSSQGPRFVRTYRGGRAAWRAAPLVPRPGRRFHPTRLVLPRGRGRQGQDARPSSRHLLHVGRRQRPASPQHPARQARPHPRERRPAAQGARGQAPGDLRRQFGRRCEDGDGLRLHVVRRGRRAWTPDRVFEARSRCLLMCPWRGEILQCRHAHGRHPSGSACRSVRPRCLGWERSGDRPQPSRTDGLEGDRQGNDHRLEEASPVPDSHRGMGPRADPEVPKLFDRSSGRRRSGSI